MISQNSTSRFNAADNPYTESDLLKFLRIIGFLMIPMRYRDEKFYWTYQQDIGWPDDYIGPDLMTWWIIEKSVVLLMWVC